MSKEFIILKNGELFSLHNYYDLLFSSENYCARGHSLKSCSCIENKSNVMNFLSEKESKAQANFLATSLNVGVI